ncbi:MAG: tetratricopeptide repeat protein [Deltaproteobacteria bacterium]|nr:tetratricopeptide repeat protein [Deltaproteobacteria bacterium]
MNLQPDRRGSARFLALLLLCCIPLPSCVTMGRYNALKDRTAALETQTAKTQEDLATLTTRIDNLKGVVYKDLEEVRGRLAELAADVSEQKTEVAKHDGRLQELEYKLNEIAKRVKGIKGLVEDRFGADSDSLPEDLPTEAEPMFEAGMAAFKGNLARKSRAIFQEFIRRFPDHEKTDDAEFMVGETLFAEGRFTEAVNAFKTVYDRYQTGDRYREAVLRIGLSYVRLNNCKKARTIYDFAKKTFKGTEEAKTAEKELKDLDKVCK